MMAASRGQRRARLEVRSREDGAWYDADVVLEGSRLRVHFSGFGDDVDEFWEGKCLESTSTIMEIMRLRSKQLQDSQCTTVSAGMIVCANYKTPDDSESKYYDAKVLAIRQSQHSFQKDGMVEICKCRFKVAWEAGPSKRKEAILGCADVCLLNAESLELNPVARVVLQAAHDYKKKLNAVVREERDETPLERDDGSFMSSRDIEGLPLDVGAQFKNYYIFEEFLVGEGDKLKEAIDVYNTRN